MKTPQTTSASETPVNQVRFSLTWFAFLFAGLLWLTFIAVLLRHSHFQTVPFPALPLFLLVALAAAVSFALHFFHAADAEWNAFPYWLDEATIQKKPFLISIPNVLTAVLLLGWNLSGSTISAVLTLLFLEVLSCRLVPGSGEMFARRLRHLFTEEKCAVPTETPVSVSTATTSSPFSDRRFPAEADTIRLHPEDSISLTGNLSEEQDSEEEEGEPSPPDDLLISQNRCLNSDDTEREEGWFRVPFRPGQTVSICHLSFCPPFRTRPKLQLFQLEGDEVQVTPTVIEPFGARVEIKRAVSSEAADGDTTIDRSVRICFFADESESATVQD